MSRAALEAALAVIAPGVATGDVDAAARTVTTAAGLTAAHRTRLGYQHGLRSLLRGNITLAPGGADVLRPGMCLHMPLILFAEGDAFTVSCSETVLVTEEGCDVLSTVGRELLIS